VLEPDRTGLRRQSADRPTLRRIERDIRQQRRVSTSDRTTAKGGSGPKYLGTGPDPLLFLHLPSLRSVVVGGVRRMNEVNARQARLVPGWVTVFERVYHLGIYVTSQLGQRSLASLRGRLVEYQLRLG